MTRTFQLDDFGVDLTMQARTGRLDPVVGRQNEIERMVMILGRKGKNNPVLLGEPGVGKTAVVEGLAQWMVAGRVPNHLRSKTIYGLNLGQLLAGTSFRGDFEQRLQDLVKELRRAGANRLLFIDEIHLLGRAGRSEGGLDAANLLKPLLARGELPCIGASTAAEWANMVAADPALERRFQPVEVCEPTAPETTEILKGCARATRRTTALPSPMAPWRRPSCWRWNASRRAGCRTRRWIFWTKRARDCGCCGKRRRPTDPSWPRRGCNSHRPKLASIWTQWSAGGGRFAKPRRAPGRCWKRPTWARTCWLDRWGSPRKTVGLGVCRTCQ